MLSASDCGLPLSDVALRVRRTLLAQAANLYGFQREAGDRRAAASTLRYMTAIEQATEAELLTGGCNAQRVLDMAAALTGVRGSA